MDATRAWLESVGLESVGLEQYFPAFGDNAIEYDLLADLTHDLLKEIGVTAIVPSHALAEGERRTHSNYSRQPRHRVANANN